MNENCNIKQNKTEILKDHIVISKNNDNRTLPMPLSAFRQALEDAANEPIFSDIQDEDENSDYCSETSEIDEPKEKSENGVNISCCNTKNITPGSNSLINSQFSTPLINKPEKQVRFTPSLVKIQENNGKNTEFMSTPNNNLFSLDKKSSLKNFMTCSRLKDTRNICSNNQKFGKKLNMSVDGIIERTDQISFKHIHEEKIIPLIKIDKVESLKTPQVQCTLSHGMESQESNNKENLLNNEPKNVHKALVKTGLHNEKQYLLSSDGARLSKKISPDSKPGMNESPDLLNEGLQRIDREKGDGKENLNKICTVKLNKEVQQFDEIIVNNTKYLVLNELGKGGSSVVYFCYDPDKKTQRAIKKVSLRGEKLCVEGYINEVRMLHKLQNCDRIIKMYSYEIIKSEKVLYMVLEKGDQDLSNILKDLCANTTHLPIYILIYYWMEMLNAVKQIHEKGIIHSDLKPANFLAVRGRLKLIDFGIASAIQSDMTSVVKNVQIGSFNYISPEALHNNSRDTQKAAFKISYKSDVWSLGCILYQFVYGKTPFQHIGHMYAKLSAILDPDQKINYPEADWVPPKIISTIKDCLQYNMKSRPSIDELIQQYDNRV